jgi:serine/threonine-protein kinase
LEKDPKRRLRDIGDARDLLDEPAALAVPASLTRVGIAATVAAGILAAVAGIAGLGWWRATRPVEHPLVRISAQLVPGDALSTWRLDQNVSLTQSYPETILALSPDGTRLAAEVRVPGGFSRLVVRKLDQRLFVPLPGTESAGAPFFSPDSQWIGFFSFDRKLKKVSVKGGAAIPLCDASNVGSGDWGDDGNIVAALNGALGGRAGGALSRVPSTGGTPTPVTELRSGERGERWPQVLPGSQAVLFTSFTSERPEDADVEVVSLNTHARKTLVHGAVMGKYLAVSGGGYLLFLHQNTLLAAPFDPDKLELKGTPQTVLYDVSAIGGQAITPGEYHFSQTGAFVYISGTADPLQSIFRMESSGRIQPLYTPPGYYDSMRFSPDGKYLAFAGGESAGHDDIWVKDLARDTPLRLTSMPGANTHPVWTPDAKYIVFASRGQPNAGLYWVRADGSGQPQRLAGPEEGYPLGFSPEGNRLGLNGGTTAIEIDSDHPKLGKLEPFPAASGVALPAYSPDFHWVAYRSDETGTPEIYVRSLPGLGGKQRISNGGGRYPIWSHNGRELFFLGFFDRHIMVVDYKTKDDSFLPGKPRVWSEKQVLFNLGGGPFWPYGLAPDDKGFAVLLDPDGSAEAKPSAQLTFLLNFPDELRRRVPLQ